MKVLIGVIEKTEGEHLFIMEDGVCRLEAVTENNAAEFINYSLLKNRPFKIREEPLGGSGVFRFRYGPVTSGIREAGCFYLYTYGEKILRAGIDLSWKHRNIEAAMGNKNLDKGLQLAEKVCSNFAFAHSVAYSRAIEKALDISISLQTKNWRTILLEAERVYNNLHVIYRLTSAAAQKVMTAHLSALFEEALRINEVLTGSRYLMGINQVGKLNTLPEISSIENAIKGYQQISKKFVELYKHSLTNPNYLDRLHGAGILSAKNVQSLGLTGPSSRACGVKDDLNGTHKHLIDLPVITQNEGDALARMEVRSEEIVNSCQYLVDHLKFSDTWSEDIKTITAFDKRTGEGCSVANSASGAMGYYVAIEEGNIQQANIFTPSYVGMHAISAALQELVFTDFPFVFDSFGVHFTDAAR